MYLQEGKKITLADIKIRIIRGGEPMVSREACTRTREFNPEFYTPEEAAMVGLDLIEASIKLEKLEPAIAGRLESIIQEQKHGN